MANNSPNSSARLRRPILVLQGLLILSIFTLLMGCFYFPVPEHRKDKTQPDFRDMVGDEKSGRPIRPGAIREDAVLKMLGQPSYVSADGGAIAYLLTTERGAWVWPLCFAAPAARTRTYALRLRFDTREILTDWKIVTEDVSGPSYSVDLVGVIQQFNADGPQLIPTFRTPMFRPTTQAGSRP